MKLRLSLSSLLLITGQLPAPPYVARPSPRAIWIEAIDVSGSVSRDGHLLSFVDWTSGGDVAIRDLVSNQTRRLTDSSTRGGGFAVRPILSPDEKKVAFSVGGEIKIADLSGAPPRVLRAKGGSGMTVSAWMRDGRGILACRSEDARKVELGIMTIADGSFRPLATGRGIFHASVSPSGDLVAFEEWSSADPARRDIRIVSTRGGPTQLLLTDGDNWSPEWTPDGNGVLFISDRDGGRGLWYADVRGGSRVGSPRRLASLLADMTILGVSDNGTVFLGEEGLGVETFLATAHWPEGTVEATTRVSTPTFRDARRAVFSPNSKHIAYSLKPRSNVVRPGWFTPTVRSVDGAGERAFPTHLTFRDEPVWFPDGKSLLLINDEAGSGEGAGPPWTFWSLNIETGAYNRLGEATGQGLVRLTGIKENLIVYRRTLYGPASPTTIVEGVDLRTRASSEVYRLTGDVITDVALSNRGDRVAMTVTDSRGRSTVQILTLGQASPAPIATLNRTNLRAQLMWFADDRSVLISGQIGTDQGIWRIPIDGSPPQKLLLDAQRVVEARVSPDGQRLAFTVRSPEPHHVWALDRIVPTLTK
jgi:Tol biopolymer transport system component